MVVGMSKLLTTQLTIFTGTTNHMSYELTTEQNNIIAASMSREPDGSVTNSFISIRAVAGSSKSYTMVELSNQLAAKYPNLDLRFLVFGNANSKQAQTEMNSGISSCSTLHSLAYQSTVKQYDLMTPIVSSLSYRDLPKSIKRPFGTDVPAIKLVDSYCNSGSLSIDSYVATIDRTNDEYPSPAIIRLAKTILNMLAAGQIKTTHSFYLKLYHILLMNGTIEPNEVDVLILDEAGDLTPITVDIFDKLPAKQKIMLGDDKQVIMGWMGCVNGFDHFAGRGIALPLSKSFRVTRHIAAQIEQFGRKYMDPEFIFEGMDYEPNPVITTTAYLTRTNASLIAKMIQLNETGIAYKLSSSSKIYQIFKLPLALIYLKPGFKQNDPELKYLQQDVDTWARSQQLRLQYPRKSDYIKIMHEENPAIAAGYNLIARFTSDGIITAYKSADAHKKLRNCNHTIMTGTTSKGSTFDAVELDPDIDKSIEDILPEFKDPDFVPNKEQLAELMHFYVSISRCRHHLTGSQYITNKELI